MLQVNNKKNIFFLDLIIFLLPISMILGNAAININCLIIILIYLANLLKDKKILISGYKFFYLLSALLLFFILNIYFSSHQKISIISFLGIIKYILLVAAILYCCQKSNFFIKNFSKLILIILMFVCLDVLIQYFFGKDIFGYEIQINHGHRLSGPFGDEKIVGSFLAKFVLISLFFFTKEKRFYELFYLIFVLGIILLSNERSASLMCLAAIFLYLLLTPNFTLKIKVLNLSCLIISIIILFNINTQLKEHYIDRTLQQFGIIYENKAGDHNHDSFWDSRWGAHFLTAIEINKNYPLLGSGLHTYRIECSNKIYEEINSIRAKERCNTHPHNIYLEIWSELGTLFFIFFVIFNIYFLFKLFKVYFFNKKNQQEASIIISLYFMLFFPIQTTGSLFSTWNGLIYWILIALCLNLFTNSIKNN